MNFVIFLLIISADMCTVMCEEMGWLDSSQIKISGLTFLIIVCDGVNYSFKGGTGFGIFLDFLVFFGIFWDFL